LFGKGRKKVNKHILKSDINMADKKDWGMEFIVHRQATFPGRDRCHFCKTKIGIFNTKIAMGHFGLNYRLCKDCFKKHKKNLKINNL
jgi:hypothetical protein